MKVGIIGGGNAGITLYALMLNDAKCKYSPFIYSSAVHMKTLNTVYISVDPLRLIDRGKETGFRLKRKNLYVTHSIAKVIKYSDIIINTLPIFDHISFFDQAFAEVKKIGKTIFMINLSGGFAIFDHILKQRCSKVSQLIPIASSHTLTYASRVTHEGIVLLNRRKETLISLDNHPELPEIVDNLADFMDTPLTKNSNHLYCAIDRSSYVMHPTITALNFNKIERRESFFFYRDGLTNVVYRLLIQAGHERRKVCVSFGFNEFISPEDRMKNFVENYMEDFSAIRPPSSANHRYFTEDIPYGLVFLCTLGKLQKINMPICESIINLSSVICKANFWDSPFNLINNRNLADLVLEYRAK